MLAGGALSSLEFLDGENIYCPQPGEIASAQFSRIQFHPDLMPADITGTEVILKTRQWIAGFRFIQVQFCQYCWPMKSSTPPGKQPVEAMQRRRSPLEANDILYPLRSSFWRLESPIRLEDTHFRLGWIASCSTSWLFADPAEDRVNFKNRNVLLKYVQLTILANTARPSSCGPPGDTPGWLSLQLRSLA
ncbi:MAG: AAA family ATPase [Pirellulales bacterium]